MIIELEVLPDASAMEAEIASMLAWIPERDRASLVRVALHQGLRSMLGQGNGHAVAVIPGAGSDHAPKASTLPDLSERKCASESKVQTKKVAPSAPPSPSSKGERKNGNGRPSVKKAGRSDAMQIVGMFRS